MTPQSRRRRGAYQAHRDAARGQGHGITHEELRTLVRDELRAVLARLSEPERTTYSTRAGGEPPEYEGRHRAWLADAPKVPGARRVGRWLFVDASAYRTWLESRAISAPAAAPTQGPANDAAPWSPSPSDFGLRRSGGR